MLTRDMKRISAHYAQDFKQDGCARDAFLKGLNDTVSVVTNYVVKLTKFEPVANNPNVVIIDGTVDLGPVTAPFADRSMIIKENGVWKWYGNQK